MHRQDRIWRVILLGTLVFSLSLSACASTPAPISPKVIVLTTFGGLTEEDAGESGYWVVREGLTEVYEVPGAFGPIHCNESNELCMFQTGVSHMNAATSMMALGTNSNFDLRKTYFIVAGIAGTPPTMGTLGFGGWARYVVDMDTSFEIDAREIPAGWGEWGKFKWGCWDEPFCDGDPVGNEVYALNADFTQQAYNLSKDVGLAQYDEASQAYVDLYPVGLPVHNAPFVAICDSVSGVYFYGKGLSDWASWWVSEWTDGEGARCTSACEDIGILTALDRLTKMGLADFSRAAVLRTASDVEYSPPGEDYWASTTYYGYMPSIENAYRIAVPVVHAIISEWDVWESGVPKP